jgi:hypothetical protein
MAHSPWVIAGEENNISEGIGERGGAQEDLYLEAEKIGKMLSGLIRSLS